MPVCVLRLGDFINTRILIQSMNISYGDGGMQWDMNPEGAGVQPMLAKVNLGIVLLGGQSLEAPISRLQNAVTFNYYANTGVYDNRADRAHNTSNYDTEYDYLFNVTNKAASSSSVVNSTANVNTLGKKDTAMNSINENGESSYLNVSTT